jgi:hypothetical protein
MMVFLTNWDLLDLQNKVLALITTGTIRAPVVISDLGATFGKSVTTISRSSSGWVEKRMIREPGMKRDSSAELKME